MRYSEIRSRRGAIAGLGKPYRNMGYAFLEVEHIPRRVRHGNR